MVEVHGLINLDGALAGRLAGRGVVWQLIDTRPPPMLRWMMMPLVLLLADVIMTTGAAVAAEYPGARLRPTRLIPFIPPVGPIGAGADDLEEERRCPRQRLSVSDEAVLIASVGNLNPQKGYEQLIDAVADCRARADRGRSPAEDPGCRAVRSRVVRGPVALAGTPPWAPTRDHR